MSSSAKKFIFIIFGLFIVALSLLGILIAQEGRTQISGADVLEIYYFDVGQGDSIFIKTPYGQKILIDGGPDNTMIRRLSEVLPFYDKKIDVMILTHPHADHVTGLVEVLKRYKVGKVYHTGAIHTSADYLRWLELIKEQGIEMRIVKTNFDLELGPDLKLQFLYPLFDLTNQKVENLNNASIINRLVYKNRSFLFSGDAEAEEEEELLSKNFDLKSDVLKVGHHGSNTATSDQFLESVDPQIAVIQCGRDNDFGHPHLRTVRKLEKAGIDIKRTDLLGTISIFTDGNSLEIR